MSVLIKGITMPENCLKCPLISCGSAFDDVGFRLGDGRAHDCPLKELPEHHGRLIDANALSGKMLGKWTAYDYEAVATMPTIVEKE